MGKLDITSTAIEKGIDIAKDFLDKLIMPSVEEAGLLLREKVTFWKFQNQVRMLNKAKAYCEKHRISPKTISFKLLVPLLETSALEEDELLQDKWSILLANMVDSEQNVENHVFPYILGQISKNEFLHLEKVCIEKRKRVAQGKIDLEKFLKAKPEKEKEYLVTIHQLKEEIKEERGENRFKYSEKLWNLQKQLSEAEKNLRHIQYHENTLTRVIMHQEEFPDANLREFEISNLSRLGVIKFVQENFSDSQTLEIPNNQDDDYLRVDFDLNMDYDEKYLLTELGELFINACTEKSKS